MRLASSLMLAAALVPVASASDGEAWALVPAARDAHLLQVFALPSAPDESVVRFVGADPGTALQRPDSRRVFAIELPGAPDGRVEPADPAESGAPAVPPGAHWPDAHGRIAAGPPARGGASMASSVRNPWEVRVVPKAPGREIVFDCGGIITGGEGGSVAILNGHIVRRGDSQGEFIVAGVLAIGVMLEKDGSFLVIPKGRRITVAIVDG